MNTLEIKTRTIILLTATFLLGVGLAIGVSEVLLRAAGFKPWTYSHKSVNEPTMQEPDPVLGWKNIPGTYLVPPYHPSGHAIQFTLLEDGQRRTGVNSTIDGKEGFVFIGDSLTQGWAISDDETFAWKLQERFPIYKVLNYGTAGYGTYQSLLLLEQKLPRLTRPKFVLYGFMDHHEVRNCAAGEWLQALASHARRGQVAVPFASVDAQSNSLVRYSPDHYVSWPFRQSFALVKVLESAYMKGKTISRCYRKRSLTEQILRQMKKTSETYGSTLVVVLLRMKNNTKAHYVNFLTRNNVRVFDCVYKISDSEKMKVPGEGHPNGRMNTLWAECISDMLKRELEGHNRD
jgi:hypothetical protein